MKIKIDQLKDLNKILSEDRKDFYRSSYRHDYSAPETNALLAKAGSAFELIANKFDGQHFPQVLIPNEADQRYLSWLAGLCEYDFYSAENIRNRKNIVGNQELKYKCDTGAIIATNGKICCAEWEIYRNSPHPFKYLLSCGRALALDIKYIAMARLLMNGKILLSICPASEWTKQLKDRLKNSV